VLFNVGARLDDRVTGKASTFAPRATIIHVDIDPSQIGKTVKAQVAIVGDARSALRRLLDECNVCRPAPVAWLERIGEMQRRHPRRSSGSARRTYQALMPHEVYSTLNRVLQRRGNYRVVTDVGQHQMWAAQLLDCGRPRSHITSGGSGTMGFSIPAAMGAALASPAETIWVVCGDGGFQMTNQELATLAQEGITNLKVAIINNGYLGMVRQWQQLFEGERYSHTTLSGPDFARLAEAYGLRGITMTEPGDVEAAIDQAWDHPGAVVIDFQVEREHNVFPIVPQGKSIGEMITEAPQQGHWGP